MEMLSFSLSPVLVGIVGLLLCVGNCSALFSHGNNVCGYSCTEDYTAQVVTSADCGFQGWSTCTAYRYIGGLFCGQNHYSSVSLRTLENNVVVKWSGRLKDADYKCSQSPALKPFSTVDLSKSFTRTKTCYQCCEGWSSEEGSEHCDIATCFGLAPKGMCRNEGRCIRPDKCDCPPGTRIPECDDVNECLTDNGECDDICENTIGGFVCNCATGRGLVDDKHCAPICFGQAPGVCQNDGTCVAIDKCDCPQGTKQPSCADVDECLEAHGCSDSCVNTLGTYLCKCEPGYGLMSDKRTCSPVCFGNDPGKCSYGNKCKAPDTCDCESGFTQPDCEDEDECTDPSLCDHVCVNTPGTFHCDCRAGYVMDMQSKLCKDLDECAAFNAGCSHECANTVGSFTCKCPEGYQIGTDHRTCEDRDECLVSNGGCYLQCFNTIGSYKCECGHGYQWEPEEASCKPTCFGGEPGKCQNGGTCSNPGVCACLSGYLPPRCTDIDECKSPGLCVHTCNNIPGSYKCSCYAGYELQSDKSCKDIDECQSGTAVCEAKCTNTDGSYTCECPAQLGWDKESLSCKPVCFGEEPGTCAHGGECISPNNCACKTGFKTLKCDDIDECAVNNGGCELDCINTPGSYSCKCGPSYAWVTVTETCAPVCNLMDAGTCPNGGVCIQPDVCQCAKGYGGTMCSDVDECSEGVASCNYYRCHNTMGSYYCDCESGYSWSKNKQACLPDCSFDEPGLCPNGGQCSSPGQCTCADGYQPPSCSDIDECAGSHGCERGCVNTAGGYYCESATPGYGTLPGSNQSLAICFGLLPGKCPNEGFCVEPEKCNCPVGFFAPKCDAVDACKENSEACTGSSTCASAGGKVYCKTQEGYGRIPGEKSNKPICFEMYPGKCPNGGECVNPDVCRCSDGFIPPRCEDVNECLADNGGCDKECVNTKGSYYCSCWEGYGIGPGEKSCKPICFGSQPGTCNGEGTCIAPGTCSCAEGYENEDCSDENECLEDNGGCQLECHNSPGSYTCDCQAGFGWDSHRKLCRPVCNFGSPGQCPNDGVCSAPDACECADGFQSGSCDDIDECATNDGGCESGCVNILGQYYCAGSKPGFGRVPGETIDKPVCYGDMPGTCPNSGTCVAPGQCSCALGYDEPECDDLDECKSGAAKCPMGCSNLDGSYFCKGELPGYGKAPGDTIYKPVCGNNLPGVCSNEGRCVKPGVCQCAQGFMLPDCTERENSCGTCESALCSNFEGPTSCRCSSEFEQFTDGLCSKRRPCSCTIKADCVSATLCNCAPGYEGDDCTDIDECKTDKGGCNTTCVNIPGSYYCQADQPGYGIIPGEMEARPVCFSAIPGTCANGGNCSEPGVCSCADGYQQPECSDVDECASARHTCQSGCVNLHGSFKCDCPKDYMWDDMDKTCKASCFGERPGRCANGGTCIRPWVCECKDGFSSPDCSDIDECAFNNGKCDGVCKNTVGSFFCECPKEQGWNVYLAACKPICMGYAAGECPNDGECTAKDSCKCKPGYKRPDCSDIDECTNTPNACGNDCVNTEGSYYCTDGDGYGTMGGTGEKISLCYLLPPGICPNDGTCIEPEKCVCAHGFMPPDCSDKNECAEDNGGCEEACHNTKGSYYCDCRRGYGWSDDDKACKPVCFGLPPGMCPNGGECLVGGLCSCSDGFKAPDCSDIDECSTGEHVCEMGCNNNHGSYSCDCPAGYHWKPLEKTCLPICFGLVGVCLNHGTCTSPGVCSCKEGFDPPSCTDIDECALNNGGCDRACSNLPGTYQCACVSGYQYDEVSKECKAVCGNNPIGTCPNEGTCISPGQCKCLPGFDPNTGCTDIDECIAGDMCKSRVCVNTKGSYYCQCEQTGYGKGPSDTTCKPICSVSSPGLCPNGGTCGSPDSCSCADGYEGPECSDINECLANNDCSGGCINQDGGYSCDCLFGYKWNPDKRLCKPDCPGDKVCQNGGECVSPNTCSCPSGFLEGTCQDVNECENSSTSCDHGCVNFAGSYYCKSDKPGYGRAPGDKYMKPVCNGLKPGTCSHGGICFSPGTCSCPDGFETADSDCQDIDECSKSNGGCTQHCENLMGSYKCDCDLGYGWDDKLKKCAAICDNLAPGECLDGGTCVSPGVCQCKKGFKEPDCSDVDECSTGEGDVCTTGCLNRHGFFFCQGSKPGFGRIPGEDVDKPICHDSQFPGSCPNGGQCIAPDTCDCKGGFELPYCADINECETKTLSSDCLKCINVDGSYHCTCEPGYAWNSKLETCTAVCYDSSPGECPNGGTCVDPYVCSCRAGFSEPTCEDIDECLDNNGGCSQLCENKAGSFACQCNSGFSLKEDLITCLDTDECEANNGDCPQKCVNMEGTYKCTCGEGYKLSEKGVGCNDIDECIVSNGGCAEACNNTIGSFVCSCGMGRGVGPDGKSCSAICYHYAAGTCGSGGICLETDNCLCSDGYNLPYCTDVDECIDTDHGCSDKCKNTDGSFMCSCRDGYELIEDEKTCEDIDECSSDDKPCSHDCVNLDTSFVCLCPKGYYLDADKRTCLGEDQCDIDNGGCKNRCENTQEGPHCICFNGYSLVGHDHCIDEDECEVDNGECSSVCRNTQGSWRCECEPGFRLKSDGKTCERCSGRSELDCLPLCVKTESECLCPDGYYPHEDGIHCLGGCPCQNDGYCVSELPLYECDCSQTGYRGDVCTIPTIDIPTTVSVRYPDGTVSIPVTTIPKIAVIIKAHIGANLSISTNPIAIKTPASRGYFNVTASSLGIFRIEYGVTGVDAERFDTPPGTDVISGDIFHRHQLYHQVLPVGCFKLELDHRITKTTDRNPLKDPLQYKIELLSTSTWYQLANRTDVFFTFGVVHSTGRGKLEFPLYDNGIELTVRSDIFQLGPVSPYRRHEDGHKVGTLTRPTCSEIWVFPEDRRLFRETKSLYKSLFRSIKPLLPMTLDIEIADVAAEFTGTYMVQVLTGQQVKTVGSCKLARVINEALYYVFRFTHAIRLKVFGKITQLEQTKLPSEYCMIVTSPTDFRETVHLIFPDEVLSQLESIVTIKSIQEMTGTKITLRGFSTSPVGHTYPNREAGYWDGHNDFEFKLIPSPLCLHLDMKTSPKDGHVVSFRASVNVMFPKTDFAETFIPLFIRPDRMIMELRGAMELRLPVQIRKQHYEINFYRTDVDEYGLATFGVESERRLCDESSNPIGLFFKVKPDGQLLPSQSVFGDISFDSQASNFYFMYDRMNKFQAMESYYFFDTMQELKNLTKELSLFIHKQRQDPNLKSELIGLPEIELIASKIADVAVSITKRQKQNVSNLVLDSLVVATVAKTLSEVKHKIENLDQKLMLTYRKFFDDQLILISDKLDFLFETLSSLVGDITSSISPYLQGPNSWGLKSTMSLHLLGKILTVEGLFHYTGEEENCRCHRDLGDQTGKGLVCINGNIVGIRTKPDINKGYEKVWEFIRISKGSKLKATLSKEEDDFSTEIEVKSVGFGPMVSLRMSVVNSELSIQGGGNIWNMFTVSLSARILTSVLEKDEAMPLTVTGVFSTSGEKSFVKEFGESLQAYVKKRIDSTVKRSTSLARKLAAVEYKLNKSRNDLHVRGLAINTLRGEVEDIQTALEASKQSVQSASDNLGKELQQLKTICMNRVCQSSCKAGISLGLCDSDGQNSTKIPCLQTESCAIKMPDFDCLWDTAGCHEVRLFAYNRSKGVGPFVLVSAYEQARWDSIRLTHEEETLRLKLQHSLLKYNITSLIIESLEKKQDELLIASENLSGELHSSLYLYRLDGIHGFASILNFTDCSFQISLLTRYSKQLDLICNMHSVLARNLSIAMTVDFNNLVPGLWKISKEFLDILLDSIKSENVSFEDLDSVSRLDARLSRSPFELKTNVMSWEDECKGTDRANSLIRKSSSLLKDKINEVVEDISKFEDFRNDFFTRRPITTEAIGLNVAILGEEYGIDYKELTAFLETTNPMSNHQFIDVYDYVKDFMDLKLEDAHYMLNHTLVQDWEDRLNVTTDDSDFRECVCLEDCISWVISPIDQSLDSVSRTSVETLRSDLQNIKDLFEEIFTYNVSLQNLTQFLEEIEKRISGKDIEKVFCDFTLPTFASSGKSSVLLGEYAELTCLLNPGLNWEISWWKRGKIYPVLTNNNKLNFSQTWYFDEGEYFCEAGNALSVSVGAIQDIALAIPPKLSTTPIERLRCIEGDYVELICESSGIPAPSHHWTTNSIHHPYLDSSKLKFPSVSHKSKGLYHCQTSNPYGTDSAKEIFLDVHTGKPVCPQVTLWIGYISTTGSPPQKVTARKNAEFSQRLRTKFKSLLERLTYNFTKLSGFLLFEDFMEIELLLKPYECDDLPSCSSAECANWYHQKAVVLEEHTENLRPIIRESTELFTTDKNYFFNSAYVAVLDTVSVCPFGYVKHTDFVCVLDEWTPALGPPRNLTFTDVGGVPILDWLPPEGATGFVKGYNVTVLMKVKGVVYTTLLTKTPYHHFRAQFPRGRLQIQVQAYSQNHHGDWAYLNVSKPTLDRQRFSASPIIGSVVGAVSGAAIIAVVVYLVIYRLNRISRARVGPDPAGSTAELISREGSYGELGASQADLNMSLNIPDCLQGAADTGIPTASTNWAYQKQVAAKKIYMAS